MQSVSMVLYILTVAWPMQITFRPIKLVPYSDDVKLITDQGSFSVAICATIPQARVEVPVQLDFGFCAVNEVCASQAGGCSFLGFLEIYGEFTGA